MEKIQCLIKTMVKVRNGTLGVRASTEKNLYPFNIWKQSNIRTRIVRFDRLMSLVKLNYSFYNFMLLTIDLFMFSTHIFFLTKYITYYNMFSFFQQNKECNTMPLKCGSDKKDDHPTFIWFIGMNKSSSLFWLYKINTLNSYKRPYLCPKFN